MLIEIHCRNFSDFDAALGRYVECGEKMIVSGDQVGQFVSCTKCQQQVEVPYGVGTNQESRANPKEEVESVQVQSANAPDKSRTANPPRRATSKAGQQQRQSEKQSSKAGQKQQRRSAKPSEASDAKQRRKKRSTDSAFSGNGKANPKSSATGSQQGKAKRKKQSAKPSVVTKTDVMAIDFGRQPVDSTLGEDRMERCKKCGNIVDNGQCTICKYVEPKFEKLHLPLDKIEIEITGFQRWFSQTMNEGVSMRVFEYVSHGMLGILGLLSLASAMLCMIGFGPGPIVGVFLFLVVCATALLYVGLIYKGHQFLRNPNARLAWFQKPFWNLMLIMARSLKWEGYDSRLENRRIVKVREPLFRDRDIMGLEGIKNCQVLDLQGTSVTDRGLLDLYSLKHIQCVVLKRTKVSHEGVYRLQQSFPRLWIWY